jgi:hypothetical protein
MYRIELKPGEESVFRTIEELAIGIRNGLITPRARIYHNASQKWLPIEFHPHYKKALDLPVTASSQAPAVAAPSQRPVSPTLVFVEVDEPRPEPAGEKPSDVHGAVPSPVGELPPISYAEAAAPVVGDARRPRAIRFGVVAAVLITGTYVAVSAALPSRKHPVQQAPAVQVAEVPAPAARVLTSDSLPMKNIVATHVSGPTFGGDPAAQLAAPRAITTSIGAMPAGSARPDSSRIEPPPGDVDLSIPSLPSGDSLAPVAAADSGAMRRILRAVGGKGATAPAQP